MKREALLWFALGTAGATTSALALAQMSSAPATVPRLIPFEGFLETQGAAADGLVDVSFSLYASPMTAEKLWGPEDHQVRVSSGRFRAELGSTVPLGADIASSGSLYVGVTVEGVELVGRQRLLSVPYALRAAMPPGMVAFFNAAACPPGWREVEALRGRYVVGLPAGGMPGVAVGTALTNAEDRPVGQHSHGVTDPGHNHGVYRSNRDGQNNSFFDATGSNNIANLLRTEMGTTGISVNNAGAIPGTNAPYIQLIACSEVSQ